MVAVSPATVLGGKHCSLIEKRLSLERQSVFAGVSLGDGRVVHGLFCLVLELKFQVHRYQVRMDYNVLLVSIHDPQFSEDITTLLREMDLRVVRVKPVTLMSVAICLDFPLRPVSSSSIQSGGLFLSVSQLQLGQSFIVSQTRINNPGQSHFCFLFLVCVMAGRGAERKRLTLEYMALEGGRS